jgi:uncharacterized protein YbjT (DUF2867 family)
VILVAGGTGTLGMTVVRLILAHGDTVRVLTRDPRQADRLRAAGIDAVTGDIRDPARVAAAVHGCTTVISAIHGFTGGRGSGPATIDRDGNRTLIRAARGAGADHLILISVHGAAPDHPMSLHRMKHAAEQALIGSGLRWTIIRPAPFLETWTELIGSHLADQGKALVFGRGDNPINFISIHDVAATIHHAVHDQASSGRTLDVTGPDNLTFNDIAERLIAANPTPARITHIPLIALRLMAVLAKPLAPAFARQAQAAVVMNTTDMAVNSSTATHSRSTNGH